MELAIVARTALPTSFVLARHASPRRTGSGMGVRCRRADSLLDLRSVMTHNAQRIGSGLLAVAFLSSLGIAQLDNDWVSFVQDGNRIKNPDGSIATQITNNGDEKHF